jgi:branched-chain amino acid aminotransferase
VGGNYAASLRPADRAKHEGYSSVLFTDAKEHKYIDEAGPANFFGIKNNTYITPKSDTILPSITNMSLEQIALDLGMKVERRPVNVDELDTFEEAGACGTAAIISPIGIIHDRDSDKTITYGSMDKVGPISQKLYDTLKAIQEGEIEDKHGWNYIFDF